LLRGQRDARLGGAVLAEAPRHPEARALTLRLSGAAIRDGGNPAEWIAPPLDPAEGAVVLGWRTVATDGALAVRPLEPALAAVPLLHPLAQDAYRLRARWRIASGEPALGREAVDIADQRLWEDGRPGDLMLRAEASVVAGHYVAALEALSLVAKELDGSARSKRIARQGLNVALAIPAVPELARVRDQVAQMLRAKTE
jgi:hypothetical protein